MAAKKSTQPQAPKSGEKSYIIKSFLGGVSDWDDKGIKGAFKAGSSNLSIRRTTDSLLCQQALVDETPPTGGFLDLIMFLVPASDGNTYGFGNLGHIYQRTSAGVWTLEYTDPNGAIVGAAEWWNEGAFATVTITATANMANNDTVTVGGQTYTFVTALNGGIGQILIGSSMDITLQNLADAINGIFAQSGTEFSIDIIANLEVSAAQENSGNHTLLLSARNPGAAGNNITITKASGSLTLSGSTLSGGAASESFLYWATATQLNRKLLPGASNWSDVNATTGWPKTDLTSGVPHTMREASGDLLICNGQYMAFVGYDDSYTNQALDLIPGNITYTLIERGDYAIIGTGNATGQNRSSLFSWQSEALSWINKEDIPASPINAMIDTEVPLLQAGNQGGIFYSDFVNTLLATSIPGGGQVNQDGVDNDNGMAIFGFYGNTQVNSQTMTGVWSYGRNKKNGPFILNLEYALTCTEIGSVKVVGTDVLISYQNGATYGVKKVDPNNKAVATYISLDLPVPTKEPGVPTVWTKIKLKTAALPASCSIALYYRTDKQGNFVLAHTASDQATFNTTNATEAVFSIGALGEILELMLTLTPNGNNSPEVYKAELFFK